MTIKEYGPYKGVPIFRDSNIGSEAVYLGNGQHCSTFFFKSVQRARKFIDHHEDGIKVQRQGHVKDLIPEELCQDCKNRYPHGTPEHSKAKQFNCKKHKKTLKKASAS